MRLTTLSRSVFGIFLYFAVIALAWAAMAYVDFLHDLAMRESGMRPGVVNSYGYAGLFQMGEAALIDAGYYRGDGTTANDWRGSFTGKNGINSLADFKANPDAQVKAIVDYQTQVLRVIQNMGLTSYIGSTINGVQITQSGLVAGAHLVGYGGLKDYLTSNGTIVPKDGNKTTISEYIQRFGGYAIGGPAPSYAAVSSASGNTWNPGSGTSSPGGTTSTPVVNPRTQLPSAPISTDSPDDAFFNNTGYRFNDISQPIKLFIAASLFLWLVWTILTTWSSFNNGRLSFLNFKMEMIRATVVLMIAIALVN